MPSEEYYYNVRLAMFVGFLFLSVLAVCITAIICVYLTH